MDTPPPPSFSIHIKKSDKKKNVSLGRTFIKTPSQNSNLHERNFKSELQPNRVSSRFNNNINSTAFKISSRSTQGSSLTSRLRGLIAKRTQQPLPSSVPVPEKVQALKPTTTPNIRLIANSATSIRNQNNINSVNNENKTQHTHHTHHNQNTRTQHQQQHTRTQNTTAPPLNRFKYQCLVNDKNYKILRKIGTGGSAIVYEGFELESSQTVAIKIISLGGCDQRTRESYFNEKALLERLRDSRHVVRMYDSEYKQEHKELIIVMEKGDADLAQVIDSHFKKRDANSMTIDGTFIKFYWRGMLLAVNDIHRHGIVHADLKPVNFILVKNEIKLIDFGIANEVEPDLTSIIRDYQIGTINYMAPEALRNRAADASFQLLNNDLEEQKRTVIKYNSKADIWSLGCILYNLVYGRPPFDKYKDLVSKVQVITNPKHSIQFPEISNRHLMNCMKSCLQYNPAERPTVQELLKDPLLTGDTVILHQTTKLNHQNPQSL